MADEVTDASNREQVVICLRRVDKLFDLHEEFIGLYKVDETSANTITNALSDVLWRMDLPVSKCCGQCYDGASNMSGIRQGTAAQFLLQEPRALYNHCYGHALNLAVGDTIKQIRLLRDTLDTCFEMSKLLKYSPKRDAAFEALRLQLAPSNPGFRTLCPTRWTVRATALNSIYQNFTILKEFWDQARDFNVDSECRARIIGVQAQMTQFSFLFGLVISERVLQHTDNLSKTLQNPNLTAAEGEKIAYLTRSTLLRMHSDDNFDLFWERILKLKEEFGVNEATLPRKRRAPARYEDGIAEPEYSSTPKGYYKQMYYETIDLISSFILKRFDQPGLRTYRVLQDLLLNAAKGVPYDEELKIVTDFYKDDFNEASLKVQLELFTTGYSQAERSSQPSLCEVVEYVKLLSPAMQCGISEVVKLLTLILVMPATNAVSERSASALQRVKTYLRTTMHQDRLNHLMVLHVHKDKTDNIPLDRCVNEFISLNSHRSDKIAKFQLL